MKNETEKSRADWLQINLLVTVRRSLCELRMTTMTIRFPIMPKTPMLKKSALNTIGASSVTLWSANALSVPTVTYQNPGVVSAPETIVASLSPAIKPIFLCFHQHPRSPMCHSTNDMHQPSQLIEAATWITVLRCCCCCSEFQRGTWDWDNMCIKVSMTLLFIRCKCRGHNRHSAHTDFPEKLNGSRNLMGQLPSAFLHVFSGLSRNRSTWPGL